MNAELLMDAMGYLPDEMVEKTNKLRTAKPIHWQKWAVWAACICLVLGLGSLLLPEMSGKSTNDSAAPEQVLTDQSLSTAPILATVQTVAEDHLTVSFSDGTIWKVSLENLTEIPALEPGMQIGLLLREELAENEDGAENLLIPYEIIIKEE
ncbi:MAG: hypothetical protein IJZ56_03090 [Oscillospiraceae bacterium]|nr:hypothetical protein [Oscillospiraceae bacterium]MBQ8797162.1 hypothetical protein [Oscillospiraceae bacterium]